MPTKRTMVGMQLESYAVQKCRPAIADRLYVPLMPQNHMQSPASFLAPAGHMHHASGAQQDLESCLAMHRDTQASLVAKW